MTLSLLEDDMWDPSERDNENFRTLSFPLDDAEDLMLPQETICQQPDALMDWYTTSNVVVSMPVLVAQAQEPVPTVAPTGEEEALELDARASALEAQAKHLQAQV